MKIAQRNYYGKALAELASDPRVVVMDADLAGSTKTSEFQKVCLERFVEVGIAEQNMIGIASGLAASGKIVYASTFGVFATGRCWEQIRLAVAYPRLNVRICATHCGITVGEDGASHQALEDIAIMRDLPNMTVLCPADAYEAYNATKALVDFQGPVYMRMGRADFPVVTGEDDPFVIGKARLMREGSDVTLIGCGQMTALCLEAADKLAALIKCIEERKAGNREFLSAEEQTRRAIEEMHLPEADWFMEHCLGAFEKNLDELGTM